MTPFQAYCLYSAIHAHFTTKYDYFTYNGKLKLTQEAFSKRNDKYTYAKLASHNNPQGLIVANHVYGSAKWIGDLFEDSSIKTYQHFRKINNSLTYTYKQELGKCLETVETFNDLFITKEQYPPLLTLLYKRVASFETLIIMNRLLSFLPHWQNKIKDTVQWPVTAKKIVKYDPFLPEIDLSKFRMITQDICLNTERA